MKSQESASPIKRGYIIGRLVGYLENYKYLQEQVKETGRQDNILYLYGDIDASERLAHNIREAVKNTDRIVLNYDFDLGNATLGVKDFLQEIVFSNQTVQWTYTAYFLELLTIAEEDEKVTQKSINCFELAKYGVDLLLNPDPFAKINLGIEFTAKAAQKIVELVKSVKPEGKKVVGDFTTPLLFLQYDLERIVSKNPKQQVVFLINGLETYDNKIRDIARENNHMCIEQWMCMMKEEKGVVWILLNKGMPNRYIRREIELENIWQIECINKAEAMQYLRAELGDESEEWIRQAFIQTGGQKKLLDYCIQHRKAEKMQDEQSKKGNCEENRSMFLEQIYFYEEQLKNAQDNKQKSMCEMMIQILLDKVNNIEYSFEQENVDEWFHNLWKGVVVGGQQNNNVTEGEIPKITREDPLWQIFPQAVLEYWTDGYYRDEEDIILLPCICYLVWNNDQTIKNDLLVGIRMSNPYEKKRAKIKTAIEKAKCFAEYSEYENTFYVREEIARILRQHQNFERWAQLFMQEYPDGQILKNDESKDRRLNNDSRPVENHTNVETNINIDTFSSIAASNDPQIENMDTPGDTIEKINVVEADSEKQKEESGSASESKTMTNEAKIAHTDAEKNENANSQENNLMSNTGLNVVDKNLSIEDNDKYSNHKKE